jgi:hypothetical protein
LENRLPTLTDQNDWFPGRIDDLEIIFVNAIFLGIWPMNAVSGLFYPQAKLYLPVGPATAPGVVALHCCAGPLPKRDDGWAKLLAG